MATRVPRNTFNPLRVRGQNGLVTVEELSRVQDLIKNTLDSLRVEISNTIPPLGPGVTPGTPAAPNDAPFWLSNAVAALPNAVDMSTLGAGVLEQTVTGTRATPQAVAVPEHAVLFGGSTGLLDYDATTFYFDKSNVRWGFGTPTPDASALVTFLRNQDASTNLFVTNDSAGANASVAVMLQASPSDPFASTPFSIRATYGLNFIPPTGRPYFAATGTTLSVATNYGLTFDLSDMGAVDPSWYWVGRVPPSGDQALRMQLDYAGHLFLPSSLGAGGMVWADPASTPTGRLKLTTIGSGLSFDPTTGTLAATGGTGTVTGVTGTLPIVVTPSSPTPNVSLNYDNTSITLSGAAGTPIQRAALTGVIEATAGSNATSFAGISARSVLANATGGPASPGAFPAPNSGDVLWRSGAGLVWSAIPVSSVTGAVPDTRNINTTAPLTGGGNLSADRTLAISDFVASGASHARGAVPDPGAVAGTAKFLREDATWAVAPGTGVPTSRTLAATSPILIDGGAGPLDLSANRTFSHAASGVTPGSVVYPTLLVDAGGHITSAVSGTPTATLAWYTEENEYGSNAYLPTSSGFLTVNEATYCTGTLVTLGTLTVNVLSNPLTSGSVVIQLFGRVGGSPIAVASITINVGDPAGIYTASGATGSASANDRYGLTVNESTAAGVSNFAFSALAFLR